MTSANLLIVLLVGTGVGALVGLGLGGFFANKWYLAIVAGFIATVVGGLVQNYVMTRGQGARSDLRTPTLVLVYSAIASLAGSSAAI